MPSKMAQMQSFGTEFWNDSCDLSELEEAVVAGATGATSNPVLVVKALEKNKEDWISLIDRLIKEKPAACEDEIAWDIIHTLGVKAAGLLRPVWDRTGGKKGRISLQVSPKYYSRTEAMVEQGLQLSGLAPNIAIKIPAITSGISAIEKLTERGVTTNATVSFSVAQAVACAEAVERGLEKAQSNGIATQKLTPFVTIMVGRVDDYIQSISQDRVDISPGTSAWAGIAVVKKAYEIFCQKGFRAKLLVAAYRHHKHWTEFIGGDLVLSIPYKFWKRFNASSITVESGMDKPVEDQVLYELKTLKEFSLLYEAESLKENDFINHLNSRKSLNQFLQGFDQVVAMVRARMLRL